MFGVTGRIVVPTLISNKTIIVNQNKKSKDDASFK